MPSGCGISDRYTNRHTGTYRNTEGQIDTSIPAPALPLNISCLKKRFTQRGVGLVAPKPVVATAGLPSPRWLIAIPELTRPR